MATAKKGTELVRESEIEAYLVKRVREAGGISYKFVSPGRAGVPDRIVILENEVGFVEVKAPGKKPTALQQRELERLQAHGMQAGWVSSREDVEGFLAFLTL